jgi:hypothetical protein
VSDDDRIRAALAAKAERDRQAAAERRRQAERSRLTPQEEAVRDGRAVWCPNPDCRRYAEVAGASSCTTHREVWTAA